MTAVSRARRSRGNSPFESGFYLGLGRRSDGIKELFDLIDICGQMVGDDLRELANLLGPLVAAITNDGDAARGVVVERVTTNDAARKVLAFCGARFPV